MEVLVEKIGEWLISIGAIVIVAYIA
jgi:hypothetical protein